MKKNDTKKLVILLLMLTIFAIFIVNNNVMAATIEETQDEQEIIIEPKDKIMMYDAKTNETMEVDMEELRQVLGTKANSNKTTASLPLNQSLRLNKLLMGNKLSPLNAVSATPQLITDTGHSPYVAVCRIQVYSDLVDQTFPSGTAAILGKNVALTAAHCVFNQDENNEVLKQWTIYPGFNGNFYYGGATGWDKVYYSQNWMDSHKVEDDWAICVLQDDLGTKIGWHFGAVCYSSNSELNGTEIRALGYPYDSNEGFNPKGLYQYESTGKINYVTSGLFRTDAYTCNGFSGSPIIRPDGYIVGILHGKSEKGMYCKRLDQNIIDILNSLVS